MMRRVKREDAEEMPRQRIWCKKIYFGLRTEKVMI